MMGGEPVQVKGTNEKLRPHSCPLKDSELAGIEVTALKRRPRNVFGKLPKWNKDYIYDSSHVTTLGR